MPAAAGTAGCLAGRSDERTVFSPAPGLRSVNVMASFLTSARQALGRLRARGAGAQRRPLFRTQTLASYAGEKVRAEVYAPDSEAALRAVLEHAKLTGRTVTFRGGGQAFDSQALNRQVVISLTAFKRIEVDVANACVTVGCGATWGEICAATAPHGLMPYVMVTGSAATAGGTLSSNSASRFSPSIGREGRHVEWLALLTPAGDLVRCSRRESPELFRAAIGGLGYVGAVLEIRHRLMAVPVGARVHTVFSRIEGVEAIAQSLRPGPEDTGPVALSVAFRSHGGLWGMHARSQYVSPRPLARSLFHHPSSTGHLLVQFAALVPPLRRLGYWLTYRLWHGGPRTFVDDVLGYTFFEDGNGRLRRLLASVGLSVRLLQQTFVIPAGRGSEATRALEDFLREAHERLERRALDPALADVLYLPADDEPYLLSSSNGLAGYAVTFTFESMFHALDRERDTMKELSRLCERHGGRVHLVKNVCADAEVLERMYGSALRVLSCIRRQVGATALVRNDFADRVLGSIDAPERLPSPGSRLQVAS
jgi:hypothetical protein